MADLDNSYSLKDNPGTAARTLLLYMAGIVALSAGGWIYVVGRPETHIYDIWQNNITATHAVQLPDFVLYSLPDGLWSLSSILMLHPLLRQEPLGRRLAIVAVVPMLGIISEILQGIGCLIGVFDIWDLACYSLPLISYILCQSCNNFSNLKS